MVDVVVLDVVVLYLDVDVGSRWVCTRCHLPRLLFCWRLLFGTATEISTMTPTTTTTTIPTTTTTTTTSTTTTNTTTATTTTTAKHHAKHHEQRE